MRFFTLSLVVILTTILTGCFALHKKDLHNNFFVASSYAQMERICEKYGDEPDKMRLEKKAPLLLFKGFPPDFPQQDLSLRKKIFIQAVLPVALAVNREIMSKREKLILLSKKSSLSSSDERWISEVKDEYGGQSLSLEELIKRVDVIPASLVLAQGAHETAWGSSRFLVEGNALFGEWVWDSSGIIPLGRPEGQNYSIKSFASIYDCARSYADKLNRLDAYAKFRTLRANLRAENAPLSGTVLAEGLENYSGEGKAYINKIKSQIAENGLSDFDEVVLK
ncbi:glucosaminidase domain-containing protein [Endomicrobium proavitum]|uniref:Putative Bax protein n=1 Tax=Endomicrobium proavitum TaxID=1408281 RepID=A0A0G3WJR3_9BACT|nr:glucosaminidase domain-containing protein [Endomicrobium proavitum]AKL98528.1 Putative Bax protein [Endomicrobium proavitum]